MKGSEECRRVGNMLYDLKRQDDIESLALVRQRFGSCVPINYVEAHLAGMGGGHLDIRGRRIRAGNRGTKPCQWF